LGRIEDCAQAWGAKYRGQPVGTIGHIACFSLQNSKHVTCGDGGVVGSNDERFGPLLQRFGDKGMDRLAAKPFDSTAVLGTNYRMSEPQAAVAAAQLDRLEAIAAKRARLGELLTAGITGVPGIVPPRVNHGDRATCWFYMFMLNPGQLNCTRQIFAQALQAEGAPAGAGYISVPIYKLPVFQQHAFFAGRWPVKELGLTTKPTNHTKIRARSAPIPISDGDRNSRANLRQEREGATLRLNSYKGCSLTGRPHNGIASYTPHVNLHSWFPAVRS
jgi:perosamine synthetase